MLAKIIASATLAALGLGFLWWFMDTIQPFIQIASSIAQEIALGIALLSVGLVVLGIMLWPLSLIWDSK